MFFSDSKAGLVQPYWSQDVINEAVKNIVGRGKSENINSVEARFEKMNEAFPYSSITGYETLANIEGVDPKDQHVAKAAIHGECSWLVTENISDFIKGSFPPGIKAVTPDSLLTALLKKTPDSALLVTALAWWHKSNAGTFDEYVSFLGRRTNGLGLSNFEKYLREHIKSLGIQINQAATDILKSESKRY